MLCPGHAVDHEAQKSAEAEEEQDLPEHLARVTELLEQLVDDPGQLAVLDPEARKRLLIAAGQVARPGPWAKRELARAARRRQKAKQRATDEAALAQTGIRKKRSEPVFTTPLRSAPALPDGELDTAREVGTPAPPGRGLLEPRNCYICKSDFTELHFFYDSMCSTCADLNWRKRTQTVDLAGRVALVTGGRVNASEVEASRPCAGGERLHGGRP